MREIVFQLIAGNPYIEKSDKPSSSKQIYRIKDDIRQEEKKRVELKTIPDEVKEIQKELLSKLNGNTE